jgi:hypothetical protein
MKGNPSKIPDPPIFPAHAQEARIFLLAEGVIHLHVAVQQRVGPERFRIYAQDQPQRPLMIRIQSYGLDFPD